MTQTVNNDSADQIIGYLHDSINKHPSTGIATRRNLNFLRDIGAGYYPQNVYQIPRLGHKPQISIILKMKQPKIKNQAIQKRYLRISYHQSNANFENGAFVMCLLEGVTLGQTMLKVPSEDQNFHERKSASTPPIVTSRRLELPPLQAKSAKPANMCQDGLENPGTVPIIPGAFDSKICLDSDTSLCVSFSMSCPVVQVPVIQGQISRRRYRPKNLAMVKDKRYISLNNGVDLNLELGFVALLHRPRVPKRLE